MDLKPTRDFFSCRAEVCSEVLKYGLCVISHTIEMFSEILWFLIVSKFLFFSFLQWTSPLIQAQPILGCNFLRTDDSCAILGHGKTCPISQSALTQWSSHWAVKVSPLADITGKSKWVKRTTGTWELPEHLSTEKGALLSARLKAIGHWLWKRGRSTESPHPHL